MHNLWLILSLQRTWHTWRYIQLYAAAVTLLWAELIFSLFRANSLVISIATPSVSSTERVAFIIVSFCRANLRKKEGVGILGLNNILQCTYLSFVSSRRCRCSLLFDPTNKPERWDSSRAFSKSDLKEFKDFLYWLTFSVNIFLVAGSWLLTSTSICFTKSPACIRRESICRIKLDDFSIVLLSN